MNRFSISCAGLGLGLFLAVLASPMAAGNPGPLGPKAMHYPAAVQAAALQTATSPLNANEATQAARLFINSGRERGDARLVQIGLDTLAPLLDTQADAQVQILAAIARQYLHDFDGALTLLDSAARLQPASPGLLLTRANVLVVQGRFGDARTDCRRLARSGAFDLALICAATTDMLSPGAPAAYNRLAGYMALKPMMEPPMRGYAYSVLGEIAWYTDQPEAAERQFTRAIAADPDNIRSAALMADFLLRQGDPARALRALEGKPSTDAVLVRRAIACKQLEKPTCLLKARRQLRAHLAAERKLGSFAHAREEARFLLDVEDKPAEALERARLNWTLQREFEDADILLRAAQQADDGTAAEIVTTWLEDNDLSIPALGAQAAPAAATRLVSMPRTGSQP